MTAFQSNTLELLFVFTEGIFFILYVPAVIVQVLGGFGIISYLPDWWHISSPIIRSFKGLHHVVFIAIHRKQALRIQQKNHVDAQKNVNLLDDKDPQKKEDSTLSVNQPDGERSHKNQATLNVHLSNSDIPSLDTKRLLDFLVYNWDMNYSSIPIKSI
jgi:hypothetical protein